MFDVISLGAATVDIFVKSDQFTVADNLLSLVYSSKNEISQSLISSGGGASNSSVSFSRLGLKSACLALMGSDPLSKYVIRDLDRDNVFTGFLVQPKAEVTDFSIILVAPDGGRSILTNRGPTRLEESHVPFDQFETKWLYITSLEGNISLLEQLIGYARENHIKVALNPGNRELAHRPALSPLLKHVDFLLLNKSESEILTSLSVDHPSFWDKLESFGAKVSAVTNGRGGAYVISGTDKYFSPIINTHPVDETGAGDGFGSAFVAALIHGNSLEDCLFWGIKNSASVVSDLGAKTGLLTLSQMSPQT